ncbi:phosphotransferase family protein [Aspergillus fijiensis CBS 313.89]|uniref:Phosphotransferase family protein n=1 Tax=Aspergillus fijiensis CBS 313.89 TaxID=1448319 RepID=A0A8G1RZA9_9EURO|nr:phosphotransferase family protein [Aspergillus fijiensis CBS 313.89]RAK79536.1 phosphotransferase family protein [Aspergillus fijiensis CBS 313.89]
MPIISRMLNGPTTLFYQHPQLRMANIVGDPQDFFRYTSGRWVWDERQQLQERYREFDILEMQKVAMDSSSSGSCVRMANLGEGSYNKSFKLTMGNGKTVVARVPNPNAGPAFLTTASEVATMDFLRTILGLPVPKVLAWNSAVDSTNRVGAEYIIMEYAPGKNLADVWTDMDLECKVRTMEDIVTIQHKFLSLKFSEYSRHGCLFYRKNAPPGSHPAIVEGGNLSHELKQRIAERFSIGPIVNTAFWSQGRGDVDIYRGPWASAVGYIQASALREIAWIQKHATPRSPNDPLFVSHSQNDPAEHVSLIQRYLSITPHLIPQEEGILGSFLWHPDLRTPNIFVDDSGHITSIIDWQSASAGPLFLEGRRPHFLDYNGDLILELPEDFKQLDANAQSAVKGTVTNSILLYLYEKYRTERNPLLSRVFQYPSGKTLTDPIRFVRNTWDGDITPLRESKWRNPLGHAVECPIDFSPEEIRKHYEDSEGWNEVQDFWERLIGDHKPGWLDLTCNLRSSYVHLFSDPRRNNPPPSSHEV